MIKSFTAALVITLIHASAMAFQGFGDNRSCYFEDHKLDSYWYCGAQENRCAGRKMGKKHNRSYQLHGDSFTYDGKKYYCCNGTPTQVGRYEDAHNNKDWLKTNESVTIELDGGGKCTYTKKVNVCGEEESTPCNKPTNCEDGKILRNGTCTHPCPSDSEITAYESSTSNTCVQCPTTLYQGIKKSSNSNTDALCIKCDPTLQFWDSENKTCISKSSLPKATREALKKCWRCDQDYVAECIRAFSVNSGSAPSEEIKSHCDIK